MAILHITLLLSWCNRCIFNFIFLFLTLSGLLMRIKYRQLFLRYKRTCSSNSALKRYFSPWCWNTNAVHGAEIKIVLTHSWIFFSYKWNVIVYSDLKLLLSDTAADSSGEETAGFLTFHELNELVQMMPGFLLLLTGEGKLLYLSDSVSEHLGHSMVSQADKKVILIKSL